MKSYIILFLWIFRCFIWIESSSAKKCGKTEIWTAERQKWWYEVAKGSFETTAVVCRKCRDKKKAYVDQQKAHLEELKKKKPHQNEKFFKKT